MENILLADFTLILLHMNGSNQVMIIMGWRIFQDIWCNCGGLLCGFYLDPATLERVESGIETYRAGGFFHNHVTFKTFGAIVEDILLISADFTSILIHLKGRVRY